MMKSEVLGHRH